MSEWKTIKIGEVCETISQTFDKNINNVVLINTSDVLEGKVLNHTFVKNENLKGQFKKCFKRNDILYSEIRPKNKRFAFIDFDSQGYVASTKLMVIRSNEDVVYSPFLFQLLKSQRIIDELQMLAESRSGTFPQITFSELANIEVKIPDLSVQKNIADFLLLLDRKIELNNELNDNLDKIAQNIFKEWFINYGVTDEFTDSDVGSIPLGWKVKTVGAVAKIIRGASPRPIQEYMAEVGRPWLKISDATATSSKFMTETAEYIIEKGIEKSRTVNPGTLILSNSATPGLPKIMNIVASVHDGWLIFDDYKEVSKEYLYYFLLYNREKILSLSNGSVFRNLKTDILKKYSIVVPSIDIMEKATNIFKDLDEQMLALVRQNKKLLMLRDILLPKLMSGEIDLDNFTLNI